MTLLLNSEPRGYSSEAKKILESFTNVHEAELSREALMERLDEYDYLIVRLAHNIDGEILSAGRKLKAIVSATTGLNHIDTREAERLDIKVLSLRGETDFLDSIHATAEHTWALLLALCRHIPDARSHVLGGGWDRDLFKGMELHGRTIGIIGFGRIGVKIAKYATAFGMKLLVCDTRQIPSNFPYRTVSLQELLGQSDVICLHASYSPANERMIDSTSFEAMKHGALFVNTARGELIDEAALLVALESGKIAGAALDVLSGEVQGCIKSNPLIAYAKRHNNLIITPHIGGATFESMKKTEVFMAKKLHNFHANIFVNSNCREE